MTPRCDAAKHTIKTVVGTVNFFRFVVVRRFDYRFVSVYSTRVLHFYDRTYVFSRCVSCFSFVLTINFHLSNELQNSVAIVFDN